MKRSCFSPSVSCLSSLSQQPPADLDGRYAGSPFARLVLII